MEVHAHTHTPRKKWTHYFWEFFMLFLAVTLGFLVENQREHYVEHKRAKVYAANMIKDLQADTTSLSFLAEEYEFISSKLDTFNIVLSGPLKQKNGMLYYYAAWIGKIFFFVPNNSTLEQLKNSGSLRYFSNEISAKLSSYDKSLKDLDKDYQQQKSDLDKLSELRFKLFNGPVAKQIFIAANSGLRDSVFNTNPSFIDNDPRLLQEFSGWLSWISSYYESEPEQVLIPLKEKAIGLIDILKKEYHLK